MPLFAKRKDYRVQSFILKLLNNNCPGLKELADGPRLDNRVNLVVVLMIIPVERGEIQTRRAFTAVTKEFSNTGVAVVLDRPYPLDEVILGFRFEGEMTFIRARAKHLSPMGGGFYQLGLKLVEAIPVPDYPELAGMYF